MIPPIPQTLTAVAGDGQISLSWMPSTGATAYRLYWLTNTAVSKTKGSVLQATSTSFVHVGPTNGTTYSYVVTAQNSAGESAESNLATATPVVIDLTAPKVVTSRPRAGETAVQTNRPIVVRFSEPLDGATVVAANFTVTGPSGAVAGTLTSVGDLVTFTPTAALANDATYTVTATTGVRDPAANPLAANHVFTFITASAPPTNVTTVSGNGDVTLRWTAVSGATRYILARGTVAGGPYTDVGDSVAPFFTERTLVLGTTYYFVVSSVSAAGRSMPSAEVTVTPSAAGATAPTNVTVVPAKTTALVSWPAVTGALSYNVFRAPAPSGPFTQVANPVGVALNDTGLATGTQYTYFVQTVTASGASPYSPTVTATLNGTLLSAPTNVTGTAGNTWLQLDWAPVAGATGYAVFRQNALNQQFTGPIFAGTSHVLTQLSNGTTYNFLVGAVVNGETGDLAPISVTPGPTLPPRAAIATALEPRVGSVFVHFELAAGYTAHELMRGTASGGPYTVVSTNNTDNTGAVGTTYFYVVRSKNGTVNGPLSNEVQGASLAAPTLVAPTGVVATPGNGQIMVSWNPVPGAVSYVVSSGTVSGGPYGGPGCVSASAETRCVLTGTNATQAFIVVRAQGPTLAGPNSAQVAATPSSALPAAPLPAINTGNGRIRLSWAAIAGALSYRVYRRTTTTGYTLLASPAGLSYVDNVPNGVAYVYAFETVSAAGTSVWSGLSGAPVWASVNEPGTPVNVVALPGTGQVMVAWDPVPGAASYSVVSSLAPGGPYNQGSCTTADTRCVFGGTNGTAYSYTVTSVGSNGSNGAPSVEQQSTPVAALAAPPSATFSGGNASLQHAWNAIAGATSYRVYRRGFGSDWKLLGNSMGLNHLDAVDNGVPYLYAFQTVNASGNGVWALPSSGFRVAASTIPRAPSGVTAVPGNLVATILWSPVGDATTYSVAAGLTSGGPYNAAACTAMGDTHCNLTSTNGTPYFVVVTATGPGGVSTRSSEVTFTTLGASPLIPVLTGIAGNNAAVVSWPRVTTATSYIVNRRTGTGAWSPLGTPAVSIQYDDDVLNGESTQYAVQPVSGGTPFAWSLTAGPLAALASLPVPPAISLIPGNGTFTVRWTPVAGAASYTVRTSAQQGGPYASACAPGNAFETVCNAPSPSGAVGYVVAQTGAGASFSVYSPESSGTPSTMLSVPNNPNPTTVMGKVRLTWVAGSNAPTSYRIFRRAPTTAPALIAEVNALTFEDDFLTTGTVYRYWIQPINAVGPGAWSAGVQITAP